MALKFGFYDSVDGDRTYAARDFSAIFNNLITDGVLPGTNSRNQFGATPASSGLGVTIDSGWAWFDSTYTYLTAAMTLTLSAADAVLYRWDAVVIETDAENRENAIKVIEGTPASENAFVKPTLAANQHPLCYVKVTPGLTTMVQGNIENRVGLSDCPFITGIVGTADLTQMFAAWEYDFETWFSALETTLSGDVAANLYALIQQNASDIAEIQTALTGKADAAVLSALKETVENGGKLCRVAFGSYTGTGQKGSGNPNSLTFEFCPVFVKVGAGTSSLELMRGYTSAGSQNTVQWGDSSVSWYNTGSSTTYNDPVANQYNASGNTYYYVAIGYVLDEE